MSDRSCDTVNHVEAPQVSPLSNIENQEQISYLDILVREKQNACQETGDQFHENRGDRFFIEISEVQLPGAYKKILAKVKEATCIQSGSITLLTIAC